MIPNVLGTGRGFGDPVGLAARAGTGQRRISVAGCQAIETVATGSGVRTWTEWRGKALARLDTGIMGVVLARLVNLERALSAPQPQPSASGPLLF